MQHSEGREKGADRGGGGPLVEKYEAVLLDQEASWVVRWKGGSELAELSDVANVGVEG